MLQRKNFGKFTFLQFTILFYLTIFGACKSDKSANHSNDGQIKNSPPIILWAWERPEDLRFLDSKKFGVAFLAQTLILRGEDIEYLPRRQPLKIKPETFLIAVTRIETEKKLTSTNPTLSDSQKNRAVELIKQTSQLPNVKAIQIDFDATASERNFYTDLLKNLRLQLSETFSLTITALASWCVSDRWLKDLPVDEAVPMIFDMGADTVQIRSFLSSGEDWNEPLCRKSYGIATDESTNLNFQPNRRIYVFNKRAWREADLNNLPVGVMQR